MSADEVPAEDAIRGLEWMMTRLTVARRERDQYRTLFSKLDAAFSEYVAAVRPMIERKPFANATAVRMDAAAERRARARAYREAGLSIPRIALRMGREDGRETK